MSFTFRLSKVVQEVGVILRDAPNHRFNYTMLLKMLYLADRESLKEVGQPISGDTPVAMPRGPVLSRICDLIRESPQISDEQGEYWNKFFETRGYDLVLKSHPDTSYLSEYEVKKLQTIFAQYKDKSLQQMLDYVGNLPEVSKNKRGASSKNNPLEDIVVAIGRENELPEIEQNRKEDDFLTKVLGN
ncbi:MAG: Panacea domain-containing protein [Candidatus Hydrogenedentes bacterium]|nr:Panacea domain-containing protein [Candidatus Hydrogenedentota bacterium]